MMNKKDSILIRQIELCQLAVSISTIDNGVAEQKKILNVITE
jgi:hypothetical protein